MTLSDSTGNTHGIRFSSKPPTKASASDSHNDALTAGAALDTAAFVAGAVAPIAGQLATAKRSSTACRSAGDDNTIVSSAGAALRCADSGTRSASSVPFQRCSMRAAWSIRPASAANTCKSLPRSAAGRPSTVSDSACGSTRACVRASTDCGVCSRARRNASANATVLAAAGRLNLNSPDCGMHTSLHTSHSAFRPTSSRSPANAGITLAATGSSTVPS